MIMWNGGSAGRAYLWGSAASGPAGVAKVRDIVQSGAGSVLRGIGRARRPASARSAPGFTGPQGLAERVEHEDGTGCGRRGGQPTTRHESGGITELKHNSSS